MSTHLTDTKLFESWEATPEPNKNEPDPSIILELDAVSDAYLWASKNSKDGWLSYNGPLKEIEQ